MAMGKIVAKSETADSKIGTNWGSTTYTNKRKKSGGGIGRRWSGGSQRHLVSVSVWV